jgi:hypothetical protein
VTSFLLTALLAAQIDGKLIHAVTKKPVPRANVQVIDAADGRRIADATADAEGVFHFEGLPAGRFKLATQHPRFVAYSLSGVLELKADSQLPGLTLKLTPSSAITGRVIDSDGDPIEGAIVQVCRPAHFFTEERWLPSTAGRTDDRGVFRISGLPPGPYLILAQKPDSPYRQTYYPNTASAAEAQPLRVRLGEDLENVTLAMPNASKGVIRGVFRSPDRAWIRAETPASERRVPFQREDSKLIHPETGAFEFRALPPGRYSFHVMTGGRDTPTKILATGDAEFTGEDIENLALTPVASGSLAGKVVYDGERHAVPQVRLMSPDFTRGNNISPAKPSAADGAFEFINALPGQYKIGVQLGKQSAYVKSVRQGGREMLGKLIEVGANANDPLTVIVSSKVATLKGIVERADPSAAPGAIVVEPLSRPVEADSFFGSRAALPQVDQNGAYEVSNLAPGKYRVFAFEAINPFDAYNAAVLKRLASQATEVDLRENETRELNLKQITVAQLEEAQSQ